MNFRDSDLYTKGHVILSNSANNIFSKSDNNKDLYHYKYNQFLVSPYLHRYPKINTEGLNGNNEDTYCNLFNDIYDGTVKDIQMYYPKPNNYNDIYSQRYSKKFKNYFNTYDYENTSVPNMNTNIYENNLGYKFRKTPNYQIKKEIEYQNSPEDSKYYYNRQMAPLSHLYKQSNNYRFSNRVDANKKIFDRSNSSTQVRDRNEERFGSSRIRKIAEENFINTNPYNKIPEINK